jgi:muramoyltetrapeptide carboxypeptidase LdcA involved in peptidoglycan recycling
MSTLVEDTTALVDHKGVTLATAFGASVYKDVKRVGLFLDAICGDAQANAPLERASDGAVAFLESLAIEPVFDGEHFGTARRSASRWAGSPEQRAQHLINLIEREHVDAIWPLFGKSGGSLVIDCIEQRRYTPTRAVHFIGAFSQQSDWGLFAAHKGDGYFASVLNATQIGYEHVVPAAQFGNFKSLFRSGSSLHFPGLKAIWNGATKHVAGQIIGGNLGVLLSCMGRSWMPSVHNKIVLIEDYDKHVHELHRQLDCFYAHLLANGAAAVVLGSLLTPRPEQYAQLTREDRRLQLRRDQSELEEAVAEVARRYRIPTFATDPGLWGHGAVNLPLFLNSPVSLERTQENQYTLINSAGTSHAKHD